MTKDERIVVFERGMARLGVMAHEAQWALGSNLQAGFETPPNWVRRVIQMRFGVDPDKPSTGEKLDPVQVRRILGLVMGLGEGAGVLFRTEEPATTDDASTPLTEEKLRRTIADVAKPHLEKFDQNVNVVRQVIRQGDPAGFAAFAAAQSEVASAFAAEEEVPGSTSDMTDSLLEFLWMFWPEIPQTGSAHGLHSWIAELQYLHCSEKLVEKVCRKAELRLSELGAPKKSPTG